MAEGYYTPQDIGGFGRLANMEMQKRQEDRLDKEAGIRSELANIQLNQVKANLAKAERRDQVMAGLPERLKAIPEGENQFSVAHNYFMEQGETDLAMEYQSKQSEKIEQLWKLDKYAAAKLYNETLGKVAGVSVNPVPGKDDIVEAVTNDNKKIYLVKKPGGFEKYEMPPGTSIPEKAASELPEIVKLQRERDKQTPGSKKWNEINNTIKLKSTRAPKAESTQKSYAPLDNDTLDYYARQYITTGKAPFPRGPEGNARNIEIAERAAQIQTGRGVTGEETVFSQADVKARSASIQALEKQRGSIISFVDNLDKQIDHVNKISKKLSLFDQRFLNMPARWVRNKMSGDPDLKTYELYLGEIQSEIGKLSSGSTASVAELSQGAREKWERVLDENLSVKDMMKVLKEVKEAGRIRQESINKAIKTVKKERSDSGALTEKFKGAVEKKQDVIVIKNHPKYGNVTESDIQSTMKAKNMTRQQVMERLGK